MLSYKEIDLNIKFNGDYCLLKWIIKKYQGILPYNGIMEFSYTNLYTKNTSHFWNLNGVPTRVWNQLHKDFVIARLMGRIKDEEVMTFEEMETEFESEIN